MIQASFNSLSLETLLELLAVCDSEVILDRNNQVDAEEIEVKQNVIKILETTIAGKRAESPLLKWK